MSNNVRFPVEGAVRGKTASLWGKSLEAFENFDSSLGTKIETDFNNVNVGSLGVSDWTVGSLSDGETATFAKIVGHGGIAALICVAADDAEGGYANYGHGSIQRVAGRRVVYETLVNLTTCPTFAIGLFEVTGTSDGPLVVATGVRSTTKDFIGFYRLDSGAVLFVTNVNGTGGTEDTVEVIAVADTPAAGANVRLGFAINADGTVDISVNGILKTTEAASINPAALPDAALSPTYCALSANAGSAFTVELHADELNVFASA